jgi:acetyl esterase/lipase
MPQQLRYGDHPSQYAELSWPTSAATAEGGQLPVVVVVHGGFWQTPYGAELGQPLAADLVPRGWAALNVEYRRVGDSATAGGGGWPRTCTDVAAAVDALADQGQSMTGGRLDLSRVVALGHSAGGQLAGWLGGRPTLPSSAPGASPRVRLSGLVAQAGVMDLVSAATEEIGGDAVPELMGGPPGRLAEAYDWASPIARLPLRIPSVCVHGTADDTVPIRQSADFVAAAQRAGDVSELQRYDGDHYAVITVGTPAWTLCTDALTRLLAQ